MSRFALFHILLFSIMGTLMQGLHCFEPRTRTVIDLESFMPEDHLLRQIDRIVKPAFIRKLTTACYAEGRGRPSPYSQQNHTVPPHQ